MSKVFAHEFVPKSKLFRRNRRIETRKKKAEKIKMVDYNDNYYLDDTQFMVRYKMVEVPEQKVPCSHYEPVYWPVIDDKNNQVYSANGVPLMYKANRLVEDGFKIIPAHEERRTAELIWKPKNPILKYCGWRGKTICKKLANKKVRHLAEAFKGNTYRKLYEI